VVLPSGGFLTLRRFMASGVVLGSANGLEQLHYALEGAFEEEDDLNRGDSGHLSAGFLKAMDSWLVYDSNPLYWLLHESIYCDGPGVASDWAAERVLAALKAEALAEAAAEAAAALGRVGVESSEISTTNSLSSSSRSSRSSSRRSIERSSKSNSSGVCPFDADAVLDAWAAAESASNSGKVTGLPPDLPPGLPPAPFFVGEMVGPWVGDDFASLKPLRRVAELLAQKTDWPQLYDPKALAACKVPSIAALVSLDDVFVEQTFSLDTAALLGRDSSLGSLGARVWVTNELQHSGLRDEPAKVFGTLLAMANNEAAIPS
jgi:hypothetical protein